MPGEDASPPSDATYVGTPSSTLGNIESSGGVDQFAFESFAGQTYVMETSLGSLDDSALALFDTAGNELARNDDYAYPELASRIVYTASSSETLVLEVRAYSSSQTGTYTLKIAVRTFSSSSGECSTAGEAALLSFPLNPETIGRESAVYSQSGPLSNGQRVGNSNFMFFNVFSQETRPIILNTIQWNAITRARNIYFDHFFYEMDISINNKTYTLTSQKCFTRTTANTQACFSPQAPRSMGSPGVFHDYQAGSVETRITTVNLPGTFTVDFNYVANQEYCGADDWLSKAMNWGANFIGVLNVSLGGVCPGVRPTVKWTYIPPPSNGLTIDNIRDFCPPDIQCPVPEEVLESIDPNTTVPITDFRARLFTAVQSGGDLKHEVSAFSRDGTGPIPSLATTNGPLIRTSQPNILIGLGLDIFAYISPMPVETLTIASNKNLRGRFDNVHLKEEITVGLYFPNCNDPRPRAFDPNPCLHLHENWFGQVPAPNQTPIAESKRSGGGLYAFVQVLKNRQIVLRVSTTGGHY